MTNDELLATGASMGAVGIVMIKVGMALIPETGPIGVAIALGGVALVVAGVELMSAANHQPQPAGPALSVGEEFW